MAGEAVEDEVQDEEDLGADTKEEDKADEEVPVRKSAKTNADFARQRVALKEKKSDEKEEEAELTPQARKLIEEEVRKATAPLEDQLAFRDWFAEHPEDRKFEKKAKARFEAWQNVPVSEVMKTLRAETSPEEKEKAEEKATRGSMKGGTQRAKEEPVASTQKDFEEIYKNVKRGETGQALKKLGIKN